MNNDKKTEFNLLRAMPLLFALSIFLVYFYLFPNPIHSLSFYLTDVEASGAFWGLYSVTIPILIGLIPLFITRKDLYARNYYFHIAFCLTFPLAIALSIWLWEIVGVIFIAFYFLLSCVLLTTNETDGDKLNGGSMVLYFLVFLAYCLVRLFKTHTGNLDLLVLVGYAIVSLMSSIQTFWVKDRKFGFYLSVPIAILLFYGVWYMFY